MKRYAANLLYCSPDNLVKNGVVEIDEQNGIVTDIFSLNDKGDETHSTLFFNGILLPFKPFFTPDEYNSDIFSLLKAQFSKNISCEIARNRKINLWLLQGDNLFVRRIAGENWKVVNVLFLKNS